MKDYIAAIRVNRVGRGVEGNRNWLGLFKDLPRAIVKC